MNTTSANLNSAAAINALTERANAAIDAAVDRRGKVLYITTKEYSQTTTRQMRDMERLASCNGFHIVPTERVEAYANILEGQYHTY